MVTEQLYYRDVESSSEGSALDEIDSLDTLLKGYQKFPFVEQTFMDEPMLYEDNGHMLGHHIETAIHHIDSIVIAQRLCEIYGIPQSLHRDIRTAAGIHDIGKISVDPDILNKVEYPTPYEWDILHAHEERGKILAEAKGYNPLVREVAGNHHRYFVDETFSRGDILRHYGLDVLTALDVVAQTDQVTAPRSLLRPYRAGKPCPEDLIVRKLSERDFDPRVTKAAIAYYDNQLPKWKRYHAFTA
jgi:HD-GYP domain-containing protein (c-di-GMP phosphodiesterase class II)